MVDCQNLTNGGHFCTSWKNKKMRRKEAVFVVFLLMNFAKCEKKQSSKSKNLLPYFRRQVENIEDGSTSGPATDDLRSNLVSFLVKNVREIFNEVNENEGLEIPTSRHHSTTDAFTLTKSIFKEDTTLTTAMQLYKNSSLTTLLDQNFLEPLTDKDEIEKTLKSELMHLTKELKPFEKSVLNLNLDMKLDDTNILTSISSYVLETTEQIDQIDPDEPKRVCIFCDNILSENCNDPQNKLMPSVTCEREGDLCYSQHTPFGIVDRGCFNVNHNLTTYVCSCNLCNYISISEMPYIFSNRQDWVENVVELSRTRNFRNSVFKDMSCLRCEVNTTTKTGDILNSANCLEGNIGNLPIQDCDENEICAVKAVRSDGYIWRGCVRAPLYNYWWALCDTDLCNYDTLVSIYDFVST